MTWPLEYLGSSIGKKQVLAVSGLMLCIFLIVHLSGNLLILVGPEAFNTYAHTLATNPFITVAEISLAMVFLTHIILAIKITMENQAARPQEYFLKRPTGRGATFASSSMPYTGLIILIFLILHLIHFRFGKAPMVDYHGVAMRDLHVLVMDLFKKPLYVFWYIFAQVSLGVHLSHGFSSAFGTLGLHHPKYTPLIKKLGIVFAIIIAAGFSTISIWAYLQGGK